MLEQRGVSREELKHSALVAVGMLLALGLLAAWSVLVPGVSAWENVMVAVIGSLRLTGPVAAAFAAWVAVRDRRAAAHRAHGAWPTLRSPLAVLAVVVGAFAATVTVLAMKAVLTEQAGHLAPTGLAVGAAGLALYAMIGWVVGWVLPWPLTPLLAGVGAYGLLTWVAGASSWVGRLAPATSEPYDPFEGLSPAAFADQTLWLLGLAAALLFTWAAVVTRRAVALAAAMLALLAAGTGMARLMGAPPAVAATEPMVYSCQEWPIIVCVHPGMSSGLTELGAAFTTIAARLTGTPAAFSRVEQRPRGDTGTAAPGVVPIHVDDLTPGYAARAAAEFVERLARPCARAPESGYRSIVTAWLRGAPLPSGPLPAHQGAAAWFSALTESQRRDWLRMFYTDFALCRLKTTHFGGGAMPRVLPQPMFRRQGHAATPLSGTGGRGGHGAAWNRGSDGTRWSREGGWSREAREGGWSRGGREGAGGQGGYDRRGGGGAHYPPPHSPVPGSPYPTMPHPPSLNTP
ncbi:hypothetical protein [Sphaerisporangium sp. TRM90804]|uniref:hypothetical protein n=1 Tax=Sphaerisporangium sp. TRM90804 TaxID=3031113 RepID=UPI00244D1A1F|nr:hypothetical protein [Sphaerisporangium sp. TRM90804]MDH2430001.1 hypothetical protein [Sphaerisporangium sp. TRM90804]